LRFNLFIATAKIADLKRKIEKEFIDLFPNEPPFIVAKLEDEYGYSLSNSSLVIDFLKYGDRVIAQPENLGNGTGPGGLGTAQNIHGGSNTEELVTMLNNLQSTIVNKIAMTNV
jgi:hypothetical protein